MRTLRTIFFGLVGIALSLSLVGCATYWVQPDEKATFDSGQTMQVKVMERVGILGNDWFVGGAEICDPALEGQCTMQTFHGHGGAIANYAAYGIGAAAIWPASTYSNATHVSNDTDANLNNEVFNANFLRQTANPTVKVQQPPRKHKRGRH